MMAGADSPLPLRRLLHRHVRGERRRVGVAGEGPPLLLLHGFTGTLRSFDRMLAALATSHRTIAPEALGHAGSGIPDDPSRLCLEEQAQDLAALLDALAIERADIFGYSMGGRLALVFAARYPGRIRRLAIEGASPGIEDQGEREARRLADEALAGELERKGLEWFLPHWEEKPLFASQRQLPPRWQARQRQERASHSAHGLAQSLRGAGTGASASVWHRLPELRMPVLILAGLADERYSKLGRAMADQLPNGQFRAISGAGHNAHLEMPGRVLSELLPFLSASLGP